MKNVFVLLMIPLLIGAQESAPNLGQSDWIYNYELALEAAKKKKQNIFVYFTGSDWCPPCIMLKKDFFETSEFTDLSKSYVLLYIDIPKNRNSITEAQLDHNKQLLALLNRKGLFPLIKIINFQGKALDELSGYRMNGDTQPYVRLIEKYK